MLIALMWMTLFVPMFVGWYLYRTSNLSIQRNYFFLIMFSQIFLYINLSPSLLISSLNNEKMQAMYVLLQMLCVIFFELPFIFLYLIYKNNAECKNRNYSITIKINHKNQLILAIFVLLGSLLFAYVMIQNDFFYTRIGSLSKAEKVVSLSGSSLWLIARMFEKSGLFLLGVLLFSCFFVKKYTIIKTISFISIFVFLMIFGFYFLINTRLYFALLLALILGIYIYRGKRFNKSSVVLAVLLLSSIFYSFKVVSNIRYNYLLDSNQVTLNDFIPWHSSVENNMQGKESILKRMDGVDLMAQVSQSLTYDNIPLGVAWANPIFTALGPVIVTSGVKDIKLNADTGAKNYLMKHFTSIDLPDYYSCMLTDAYGNFWIFGLVLVAIFLAKLSAYVDSNLSKPKSAIAVVMAMYFMSIALPFEQEFINIFTSFVQLSPFLLFVIIVNPIRVRRVFYVMEK